MDLTIIIVNYNTKDLTLDCVASVYKARPKLEFEIIVVDNGSSEGMPTSKRYTLIRNQQNLGFTRANNQGIKKAKGEYILLLNSDTLVKKGALEKLIKFAKKTTDAGAVAPKLLNPDGSTQASIYRFPTLGLAIRQYWLGQKGLLDKYIPSSARPVAVDAAVMAAFLITPRGLKKVGFLDERYFMYFEDLEYCRHLKKAGLKVYYLPQAQITHFHGASGKHLTKFENQWRRLIPSSKIYHGALRHAIMTIVIWSGQKFLKNP